MLDGDLLYQFLSLSAYQQKDVTKQIGTTTVDTVLEDLEKILVDIDYF